MSSLATLAETFSDDIRALVAVEEDDYESEEARQIAITALVAKIVGEIEEGRHDRAELAASSRGCLSENIGVARHA